MAVCDKCGGKLSFFGNCEACREREEQEVIEARKEKKRLEVETQKRHDEEVSSIVLTTEVSTNLNITERKRIVISAIDCALDVKLVDKQGELLDLLKQEAHAVNANAVVGVVLNVVESYNAAIGVGEIKMFKMIAYGTAVVVD